MNDTLAVLAHPDELVNRLDRLPPGQRDAAMAQLTKGLRSVLAVAGLNPQPALEGSVTECAQSGDGGHTP